MFFFELLVLLPVAIYALYKWLTLNDKVFEERGIPFIKPRLLAGNSSDIVLNKGSLFSTILKFYKKTNAHKVHGYFNFRTPFFVINDPELIKKIAIKDFDHFPNHASVFPTNDDKLLESMLSIMKDQRWKHMRNALSPVFTAAKMRTMFSLMNECFAESLDYLHKLPNVNDTGAELELKQCFTRLSNDLIASTAFGLKVNSYGNINNEFYKLGQTLTQFRGTQMVKFMLMSVAPKLTKLLGFQVFDKKKTDYFTRLVVDAMKYRQQHKIVRPDMIQLLLEAKQESSEHWSDVELAAQCFIFFFAAFENNANFICTTCHELMLNPDIQQRLYEEAVELRTELNGKPLGYDDVSKLKYMDMVLSESLRLWSLAVVTDRICSKEYKLKDEDEKVLVEFKVGDRIWFPVIGLQRDEKYFENPDVFDPERFSDENKQSINQGAYIPFGLGPRNCIGNRYALMQAKAMLYHLVLEFKIERSSKTVKNLMEEMSGFQISPKSGFWVILRARN